MHLILNHPALAQRYLMLTVADEAVGMEGRVYHEGGAYWRARWVFGMSDVDLEATCKRLYEAYRSASTEGRFPEFLLQTLDDTWKTVFPSVAEAGTYTISYPYAKWLFGRLDGDTSGRWLEQLAQYLMSSVPGCRARKALARSTDYDVICSIDGAPDDFRRELGRYFICECKYWTKPAGFTTVAKFARVLESAKCRFGILFSRNGVTGNDVGSRAGAREILKLFHGTGIIVVVVDHSDLKCVIEGANLLVMLREKYEAVRLDLLTPTLKRRQPRATP